MRRCGLPVVVAIVAVLYAFSAQRAAAQALDQPADSEVAAGVVAPDSPVLEQGGPPAAGAGKELTAGEAFVLKMKQGGWTMVFLLLASVAGVGYAIERLVNLRTSSVVPPGLAERADELWRAGRWDEIEDLPAKSNSTLARVLAVIAKHRHSSLADVSAMASDVASRDLRRHLQRAFPLAVVATVSPLLGLFGTVIGMIGAFDKVAIAGSLGDASLLGGDISKALITTAAGLTIAIPALVLYHYSKSKTNMLGLMLEEEVGELLGAWHAAPADRSRSEAEVRDAGKA